MREILIVTVLTAALFQGCVHNPEEKNLEKKETQVSQINTREDLNQEATNLINTAPNLTEEQRVKLHSLHSSIHDRNDALISESLRLRSVLIRDVLATNYNKAEVKLIQKKLKNIEEQRLSSIYEGIKSANVILGRQAAVHERLVDSMFEFREPSSQRMP